MEKLCQQLREIFEDDLIDVDEVKDVLKAYPSNPADWIEFANFDDQNAMSMTSEMFSHHQLLKKSFRYTRNLVDAGNGKYNLMVLCWGPGMGSRLKCFSLADEIGLHRMENPNHSNNAVSLHLYIPPYDHCNSFDEVFSNFLRENSISTYCSEKFHAEFNKNIFISVSHTSLTYVIQAARNYPVESGVLWTVLNKSPLYSCQYGCSYGGDRSKSKMQSFKDHYNHFDTLNPT
uniref:Cysteine dioxygenase n=1 Tax=Parascaris equorum TaxID=6256 RepID=A0A914SEP2_PAREQ